VRGFSTPTKQTRTEFCRIWQNSVDLAEFGRIWQIFIKLCVWRLCTKLCTRLCTRLCTKLCMKLCTKLCGGSARSSAQSFYRASVVEPSYAEPSYAEPSCRALYTELRAELPQSFMQSFVRSLCIEGHWSIISIVAVYKLLIS